MSMRGLSQHGGRAENAKISASDPLKKNNQMTLLPARSKTTDSTFKRAANSSFHTRMVKKLKLCSQHAPSVYNPVNIWVKIKPVNTIAMWVKVVVFLAKTQQEI
jgi:hypothetical protein